MIRRSLIMSAPLVPWLLAGCASPPPPPPPPRKVPLEIIATPDINPDIRERASPLTVRVFALKTPASFGAADFFSLYEKEAATLGADVVLREEMVLRPGESRNLTWTVSPDFKFVGVLAAFRDLERAQWRDVQPLTAAPGLRVLLSGRRAFLQAVGG